jgi:hypothetical protein
MREQSNGCSFYHSQYEKTPASSGGGSVQVMMPERILVRQNKKNEIKCSGSGKIMCFRFKKNNVLLLTA